MLGLLKTRSVGRLSRHHRWMVTRQVSGMSSSTVEAVEAARSRRGCLPHGAVHVQGVAEPYHAGSERRAQ